MGKASDNVFPKLLTAMQTADPAAPSDSSWKVYAKAGGIYARSSNAIAGPFAASGGGGTPTYVGCKVTRTTTQSINNNSITAVAFDSETNGWDTATMHDTSTNNSRITVGTTGKWLLEAAVVFAASGGGTERYMEFYKNATTRLEGHDLFFNGSINAFGTMSAVVSLTSGDYVELRVYQDSGGALNLLQDATRYPWFSATLLGT